MKYMTFQCINHITTRILTMRKVHMSTLARWYCPHQFGGCTIWSAAVSRIYHPNYVRVRNTI